MKARTPPNRHGCTSRRKPNNKSSKQVQHTSGQVNQSDYDAWLSNV